MGPWWATSRDGRSRDHGREWGWIRRWRHQRYVAAAADLATGRWRGHDGKWRGSSGGRRQEEARAQAEDEWMTIAFARAHALGGVRVCARAASLHALSLATERRSYLAFLFSQARRSIWHLLNEDLKPVQATKGCTRGCKIGLIPFCPFGSLGEN
uniref:Uncharacterized protein n=1 Tax=Oryza brachyantha TaxID=4533 RepID=J3N0G2_ORYBR